MVATTGTGTTRVAADSWQGYVLLLTRLLLGWWMLHAGLEKFAYLWDAGARPFAASQWLLAGTTAAPGWLHGFLAWVGHTPLLLAFTNVAIPVGEVLIGLGVLLGAFTRLASFCGAFLAAIFYLSSVGFAGTYVTGELLRVVLFAQLIVFGAGRIRGVDALLERTALVEHRPWLRALLG
ncbi:thiosulfate dehydrogenase [quinone] large subunit [Halarchaeum rubridurum]|uniref:Thiosulfate dehydrogenase [quinone] large subunit n=1 Tax=Halarchaeum rubridurum TaxID=489911 RepID=A0A830FXJ8_9EURY|nr:TQO small subunit DoxD [Halarchaeum rubridurum]MBP1954373.1 thiosulfate dehydrogenase [quinone] large subunit [Halarchaeum rubridurum]GGM60454.1 hypothetical protein GCM10009017_08310 [Halarchaeum rubridurum]